MVSRKSVSTCACTSGKLEQHISLGPKTGPTLHLLQELKLIEGAYVTLRIGPLTSLFLCLRPSFMGAVISVIKVYSHGTKSSKVI